MGLAHSPRIVTDGIVLALDAANTKSYGGSGTTWIDISGKGNNATLTSMNGANFDSANGGSFTFDGTSDYVAETASLSDTFWQGNWTASFWVNFDTLNTTTGGASDKILIHHGSSITRGGLHLVQRNSRIRFGLYADDLESTSTVSTGTWYNLVFALNNISYAKAIYINGTLDSSHTGGGAYTGSGTNTKIGGKNLSFGTLFDGFMSFCSFYNRVLTAAEVKQNYNALRGRYGI